jgi:purine-binding chemotaxis protein CheW
MITMTQRAESRYLTFTAGRVEYGVEIQKIREILEPSRLEPLPKPATAVRWVIRHRNTTVPIVDLRRWMGLEKNGARPNQSILTVAAKGWDGPCLMGLLVDGIREVVQVGDPDTESRPEEFIQGPVQCEGREVVLLDVDQLFEEQNQPESNPVDEEPIRFVKEKETWI